MIATKSCILRTGINSTSKKILTVYTSQLLIMDTRPSPMSTLTSPGWLVLAVVNKRWKTKSGADIFQFTISYRYVDNKIEYFLSIDIPNTTKKYIFTVMYESIYYKEIYLGNELSYASNFQLVQAKSLFVEEEIFKVWYHNYAYKVLYHNLHTNTD